jgi:hypothetical protein
MRTSRVAVLLLPLLVCRVPGITAQSVMQITTTALRPGIWVLSGFANGNILVHDDGTSVLLVDGQSPGEEGHHHHRVARVAPHARPGRGPSHRVLRGPVASRPAAGYEESFGSQSRSDQFVQLPVVGFSRQGAR